jgi:hypothetical protein
MTNDRDADLLASELHDLVDGITPDRGAGMQRAQRTITRRARNRRTAVGAGAVVVLVAATVFVAVDRETKDSQRPIGTSAPSVTSSPTTSTTTTSTTVPGSPILSTIPPLSDLPAATAAYSKTFAWGTADDQVAFQVPHGEGVSGGPIAFTADAAGNIVMLDHSNARLVQWRNNTASAIPIALADPGVTAAVFDDQGRVIVANSELAVFGPDGAKQGSWTNLGTNGVPYGQLEADAGRVFVTGGGGRTPVLRDDGAGYVAVRNGTSEPDLVSFPDWDSPEDPSMTITMPSGGRKYEITGATGVRLVPARTRLTDGSLVFVMPGFSNGNADQSLPYIVGRIDSAGHASYRTVNTSGGYLVNGPEFVFKLDGFAVMGSTTTDGVTVSYYPFD